MFKTISITVCIIIAFIFSNCNKSYDDTEIKKQVGLNSIAIQGLTATVSTKVDRVEFDKAITDVHGQIIKAEDRLTALETIKNAKVTGVSAKKVDSVVKKNAVPKTLYDVVAGYGDKDLKIDKKTIDSELYQPYTPIPEVLPPKDSDNLIEFTKKQEVLAKNGLDTLEKSNVVSNVYDDNIKKLDLITNQHESTLIEQRKTLESHGKELEQAKDFQNTTESRLRVLETEVKQLKEDKKVYDENFEAIKVDIGNIKEELKTEEDEEVVKEVENNIENKEEETEEE